MNQTIIMTIIGISMSTLYSCKSNKLGNSNYVREYYDSISYKEVYTIKKDDKLNVSIWNHDDLSIGSIYGVYNSNEVYGKWVLVNENGCIPLPSLGNVKVEGLTIQNVSDTLISLYNKTIQSPIIHVRLLNKEVGVLGEVRKPGNYILEKEKNSILEILSKAEGFDFYANKKRVKLIRKENNQSNEYLLDFRDEYIPYLNTLYLKPGDVVYIESKRGKVLDKKAPTILPLASLITATLLLLKFVGGN